MSNETTTTAREIFDRVRTHLLAQGQQAHSVTEECLYRTVGPDGEVIRCAVGCLVADGAYDPEMEGSGISDLGCALGVWEARPRPWVSDKSPPILARVLNDSGVPATEEVRALLIQLQSVHDSIVPSQWDAVLGDGPDGLRARLSAEGIARDD